MKIKANVSYDIKDFVIIIKKKNTNFKKVCDHYHYTGKYRGAAHSIYRLQYRITKKIPVIFHHGSKHDWHFIIKELATEFDCGEFKCLAENTEKYVSFSVPIKKQYNDWKVEMFEIEFVQTFKILPTSLTNLSDNLSGI